MPVGSTQCKTREENERWNRRREFDQIQSGELITMGKKGVRWFLVKNVLDDTRVEVIELDSVNRKRIVSGHGCSCTPMQLHFNDLEGLRRC